MPQVENIDGDAFDRGEIKCAFCTSTCTQPEHPKWVKVMQGGTPEGLAVLEYTCPNCKNETLFHFAGWNDIWLGKNPDGSTRNEGRPWWSNPG